MKIKDWILSSIEIVVKTATGFLPGPVSAAFGALYDSVKDGVLAKRAEQWKEDVITRLEKLEGEYEDLVNSEKFATALIKTSELAIKTESEEKRQLLANALINAYSSNIDEDKTIIFLQLIEKYTILHIRIIKYLEEEYMKQTFFNDRPPTFMVLFKLKFNDIDDVYLKKVIKDLQNDYLIEEFKDDSKVAFFGTRFEILTKLGKDFYSYLASTEDNK